MTSQLRPFFKRHTPVTKKQLQGKEAIELFNEEEILFLHYFPGEIMETKKPNYRVEQDGDAVPTSQFVNTEPRIWSMRLLFNDVGESRKAPGEIKTNIDDKLLTITLSDLFIGRNDSPELFLEDSSALNNSGVAERFVKSTLDCLSLLKRWEGGLDEDLNEPSYIELHNLDSDIFIGKISKLEFEIIRWDRRTKIPTQAWVDISFREGQPSSFPFDGVSYVRNPEGRDYVKIATSLGRVTSVPPLRLK